MRSSLAASVRTGGSPVRPRRCHGTEPDVRNHATRLPSCRTAPELRPLATARPRRFEWSAWGTHEFLGRGAKGPQPPGRGKRPGGFDPEELFGAAWWLTPLAKVAAQQTSVRARVPVVTTRKSAYFFRGDNLSLDFSGHGAVRRDRLSPLRTGRAATIAAGSRGRPASRNGIGAFCELVSMVSL